MHIIKTLMGAMTHVNMILIVFFSLLGLNRLVAPDADHQAPIAGNQHAAFEQKEPR